MTPLRGRTLPILLRVVINILFDMGMSVLGGKKVAPMNIFYPLWLAYSQSTHYGSLTIEASANALLFIA